MTDRFIPPAKPARRQGLPGKVAVRHMIEAARGAGLDPAGFRAFPDGSVEVFEARADPATPTLFDELERLNKL